jgi:large subunit ribosomal protein L21
MYAVIRAGGKQYRVAPGDVIKVEKLSQAGGENVQFDEVLAVSGAEGELGKPSKAFVTAQVVEQGRADKILVFHFKRKKQYKKLNGHRQPYTAVKITRHQCRRQGPEGLTADAAPSVDFDPVCQRSSALIRSCWTCPPACGDWSRARRQTALTCRKRKR